MSDNETIIESCDVAILGGGPAGATAGILLKKYNPSLDVAIIEREIFPRDHVGESLLPLVNVFLDEMGVWDKIEAANFPVKIGATYRWGLTSDLWNFEFLPKGQFKTEPRPGKYQGQRLRTSFQVDRSVYDKILLDHAREIGCEVRENTRVTQILRDGDKVTGAIVTGPCSESNSGSGTSPNRLNAASRGPEPMTAELQARYYIDCTAVSAILRKTMEVEVDSPTTLRNVAIWDYWRNADWAVEIGVGGTRIQILSLGYGWIWFIPLGPDRTSIGFVVPADYLKSSGKKPAELYAEALELEPRVKALLKNAKSENDLKTTNDWSYISSRLAGENWFLAGDTCGFADPILSAGMTLAHASAREVAYTILELDRGDLDPEWLKRSYEETHRRRILQHIRFADYWYGANSQFTDLVAYCAEIAKDAGLDLNPDEAFQWLGTGGFANDDIGQASVGAYTLTAVKRITQLFSGQQASWQLNKFNELVLDKANANIEPRPYYDEGRIHQIKALVSGKKVLPLTGPFRAAYTALLQGSDLREIVGILRSSAPGITQWERDSAYFSTLTSLEAMLAEGWVRGGVNPAKPIGLGLELPTESAMIRFDKA